MRLASLHLDFFPGTVVFDHLAPFMMPTACFKLLPELAMPSSPWPRLYRWPEW